MKSMNCISPPSACEVRSAAAAPTIAASEMGGQSPALPEFLEKALVT